MNTYEYLCTHTLHQHLNTLHTTKASSSQFIGASIELVCVENIPTTNLEILSDTTRQALTDTTDRKTVSQYRVTAVK